METKFRLSDSTLQQLVSDRREEVIQLQKSEAAQLAAMETRGQERIKLLKKNLPKDILTTLESFDVAHQQAADLAKSQDDAEVKILKALKPAEANETSIFPDSISGQFITASAIGTITPYYGTLHGSDGRVFWQGYNPGNMDFFLNANGAGSGLFGSGAGSYTMYMDWWFVYRPGVSRNYSHRVSVPFHGFYIIKADDGFWDSKEAKVGINLSTVGYQYNYKQTATTNVFSMGNDNINVNDRFDGWRTMYYSTLFGGGDQAYVRVTASFNVYARGGGSTARLNFGDGAANYLGMPSIYVD